MSKAKGEAKADRVEILRKIMVRLNDRQITELKRLTGERKMAGAVANYVRLKLAEEKGEGKCATAE